MAYQRNGYWYKSVREGQHVRTEYIGSDQQMQFALNCSNEQRMEQMRLLDLAIYQKAIGTQEHETDQTLDSIARQLKLLMEGALMASGYHKHSGTWRKKRKKRQ